MNKKINFDEYCDQEFADMREKAFKHNKASEILNVINKYLSDEITDTVKHLKDVIYENAVIYHTIRGVKPIEYNSVSKMIEYIGTDIDISNFHKKFTQIKSIQLKTHEFIITENETTSFKDTENATSIRNTYINTLNDCGKDKNIYTLSTFSPYYSYFVIKNNDFFVNLELSNFTSYNKLLSSFDDIYYYINKKFPNESDNTQQKTLFIYLEERGCAMKFKQVLYQKVISFIKTIDKKIEGNDLNYSIWRYITYFTMFKDVCLFPNKEFFDAIDKIITLVINAGNEYLNNRIKHNDDLENEIFYQLYGGVINEIIQKLFEYQNTLCQTSKNFTFETAESITQCIDYFNESSFGDKNNGSGKELKIWHQVQEFVNYYIHIDYNGEYFGLPPKYLSQLYNHYIPSAKWNQEK